MASLVIEDCLVFSFLTFGYFLLLVALLELGRREVKAHSSSSSELYVEVSKGMGLQLQCCGRQSLLLMFPANEPSALSAVIMFVYCFYFLRQKAGLELPMSENDLALRSLWPLPPNCCDSSNLPLCSVCPESSAAVLFLCGHSSTSRALTLGL